MLFLGFPVDEEFSKAAAAADPVAASVFLNSPDYLQVISQGDQRFIGKFAGKLASVAELALLEKNIQSLLKKVAPGFPSDKVPLVLFPYEL